MTTNRSIHSLSHLVLPDSFMNGLPRVLAGGSAFALNACAARLFQLH
jgi:hypothetical protein